MLETHVRHLALLALLGSTALLPVSALAQTATPASNAAALQQQLSAAQFVDHAANSNMFEIQSSQLALNKSQNDEIHKFAQRMVDDHTQAAQKLKAAAKHDTVPSSLDKDHAQKLTQLQNATADSFDRVYVQLQLNGHQQAVGLFQSYSQHGSDNDLKQFAANTLPTLRDHLQSIEHIRTTMWPAERTSQTSPGAQDQRLASQPSAPGQQVAQVTVQQARPEVTVHQAQPEIVVRQGQPTVHIDMPQPEIIVRMPQPNVDVSMAKPQVDVRQPQPQVRVTQAQQQPEVQVDRAKPHVRYEQTGQPQVIVNKPQGQPNVKFEQMGQTEQRQSSQQAGLSAQDRQRARERIGSADASTTASTNAAGGKTRAISVKQLDNMDVYNAKGEKLGDVEKLITDTQRKQKYIVIGHGGFLGIGEDKVAFPIDRFWMRGDRLVLRGVTEQDIEQMANYRDQVQNYASVSDNDNVNLHLFQ